MGSTYTLAAYWEGLYNKACMEIFDLKVERSKERNDAIAYAKGAQYYQKMVQEKLARLEDRLKQADFRLLSVTFF